MTISNNNHSELSLAAENSYLLRDENGLHFQDEALPCRGFVEGIDPHRGLAGWFASKTSSSPTVLELWLDDQKVAETTPHVHRTDIWSPAHEACPTGFAFPLEDLVTIGHRQDISPSAQLTVRVPQELAWASWLPMSTELTFANLQVLQLPGDDQDYLQGHIGPLGPELSRLNWRALRSLGRPLRADPRKQVGVIEFLVPLSANRLFIGGWMNKNLPSLCAMAVLGRDGKRSAALAATFGPRSDLPEHAHGFCGVLQLGDDLSAETINAGAPLLFAGRAQSWLAPIPGLRHPDIDSALRETEGWLNRPDNAHARALKSLLRETLPWNSGAQGVAQTGIKAAVDRVVVAPGFGLFATGWLLHPMSRIVNVQARIGNDTILTLDPTMLCISPRKDLDSVFPEYADRTAHAGFSLLLRGDAKPDYLDRWVMRFEFSDGSTFLQEIRAESVRKFDNDCHLNPISEIMPGFEWSPWIEEFVWAAQCHAKKVSAESHYWQTKTHAPRALVVALPTAKGHQRVALHALEQLVTELQPAGCAVIAILPESLPVGAWYEWLDRVQRHGTPPQIANIRVTPGADVWQLIEHALTECRVERFSFLGPAVQPGPQCAARIIRYLNSQTQDIDYLRTQAFKGGEPIVLEEAQAFCWTTRAFLQHQDSATPQLPGIWKGNGLPPASTRSPTPGHECMRLESVGVNPVRDRIHLRMLNLGQVDRAAA